MKQNPLNDDVLDRLFGSASKSPVQPTESDEPTEPETTVAPSEAEEGDTAEFGVPETAEAAEIDETDDDVKIFTVAEPPTQVLPVADAVPLTEEAEAEEEAPQIEFDEWNEEDTPEPTDDADHSEEVKEQFRKSRETKVRSFHLARGLKLSGEEEPNDPDEEPEEEPEYEDDYIEDFTCYEDADSIASELHYRRSRGWLGLLGTLIWEGLLLLNVVAYTLGLYTSPLIYIVDSAVLLGLMAAFNLPLLRDGFDDLREKRYSGDTAILLSVAVAMLHTLAQLFQMTATKSGLLPAVAGLGLLIGAIGRQLTAARIDKSFEWAADANSEKWAAARVEDEKAAAEIGRSAVAVGRPHVGYYRPAPFLTHFLENAYERPNMGKALTVYALASAGLSVAVAAAYGLLVGEWWQAFYLLCLCLCLAAPISTALLPAAALFRAAGRTARNGGLLVGTKAIRSFGDLHALVVQAGDLFPENSVLLNGIKTFAGTRIDEAILDAAAVVIESGGPLSHVFRRVIENKVDILPEVDTLVYEQEMGLSGWVDGRRVLVGNRKLLENHGVDVPSADYEMRYTKSGRKLVYLSTAGQLSAMFVVTYTGDETVCRTLKSLNKEGITLLVHTCDSNVTEELLTETFRLDNYYVDILSAAARLSYETLLAEEAEEPEAVLASGEGLCGKAMGLTDCRRLYKAFRLLPWTAMGVSGLGVGLCALLMFASHAIPSTLLALAYVAAGQGILWLVQRLQKL